MALSKRKSWSGLPVWQAWGRQIVAGLLLVVFATVNYAVQTHVHDSGALSGLVAASPSLSAPAPGPADNDAQHCPLCQEFLSGGNYLLPAAVLLLAAQLLAPATLPAPMLLFGRAAAHSWQGRGPPAA